MRILCLLVFFSAGVLAGEESKGIYNPNADAQAEIAAAVKEAAAQKKHVLAIVGGNWCGWCKKLDRLMQGDAEIKQAIDDQYIVVHVNYSKENKNEAVLASLGFPQRFGYPVLVVLDGAGKRLHTQNSGHLEEGAGHSPKKVMAFLKNWSYAAVDPASYVESK